MSKKTSVFEAMSKTIVDQKKIKEAYGLSGGLSEIINTDLYKASTTGIAKEILNSSGITALSKAVEPYKKMFDFSDTIKNSIGLNLSNPYKDLLESTTSFFDDYQQQENELKDYWLYNLVVDDLEQKTKQFEEVKKELETLKAGFNKFYQQTQNTNPSKPIKTVDNSETKKLSLNSTLSTIQIKTLEKEIFNKMFEYSNEQDVFNFFSENISTQLTINPLFKIIDIVHFLSNLHDEKHILNKRWANIISETKSIIYDGKPLTIKQISTAKTTINKGLLRFQTAQDLIDSTSDILK